MLQQLHERFWHPDTKYAPAPLWFLNGDLQESELARQLQDFAAHGVMGVVLHPRIGIPPSLGYLSDRMMALLTFAVQKAASLGMWVILYDEGMYPSGSANGQVVKENPRFASRGITLRLGIVMPGEEERVVAHMALRMDSASSFLPGSVRLLQSQASVHTDETCYTIMESPTRGTIRGIHEDEDDGMANAPRSADILNPDAVQCFLRLTHDRYFQAMGRYFGNTIRAFFVDEPNPVGRYVAADVRAWTTGLEDDLPTVGLTLCDLPALWLDAGDDTARIRAAYDALITHRLVDAFYAPIQTWCHTHGIGLTGHPARPSDIALEKWFDIPGQDLVWRWVAPENNLALEGAESTQALCASSSALHYGKQRCASECFGCCGKNGQQWTFNVDDMLFYLNWLFVRGINQVYPHAFLYAIETPTQRNDRPPDVGPNNIWWPWYQRIARYITVSCALLSSGRPQQQVAILTSGTSLPWRLVAQLLQRQVECTYLEQSLLRDSVQVENGQLIIAKQQYKVLAVEDASLLQDAAIAQKLADFTQQGGKVMVLGHDGCKQIEDLAFAIQRSIAQPVRALGEGQQHIRVLTKRYGSVMLHYIVNEGETAWYGQLAFQEKGYVELLSPWHSTITPCPMQENGRLWLELPRREGLFVAIDTAQHAPTAPAAEPVALDSLDIPLTWCAQWDGGQRDNASLGDWQLWPGMALFSGDVTYRTSFLLSACPVRLWLDLGHVRDIAQMEINGHALDALLKAPFRCELTPYVHEGNNHLSVCVTSCRMSYFEHKPCPAGLFGPVALLQPKLPYPGER